MASGKHSIFLFCYILCFTLTNFALNFRPVLAQKPVFACDVSGNPGLKNFSFCDASLDVKTRVDDLVNRLTLQEKIGFLVDGSKGVSRLGIPNYEWWSEALHGVSNTGPGTKFASPIPSATSFPQVLLTGATFNESLFKSIGKVMYIYFSLIFFALLGFLQSYFNLFHIQWGSSFFSSFFQCLLIKYRFNSVQHQISFVTCKKSFMYNSLDLIQWLFVEFLLPAFMYNSH